MEIRHVDAVNGVGVARDSSGTRVLLRAVHPVGETVVSCDVVELPNRLVEPRAPRGAGIDGNECALIDSQCPALRIRGIDPQLVIIITTRLAFNGNKRFAGVGGSVHGRVADVNDVGMGWVNRDTPEVPTPAPDPLVVADARPA